MRWSRSRRCAHSTPTRCSGSSERSGRWFFTMELVAGVDLLGYVVSEECRARDSTIARPSGPMIDGRPSADTLRPSPGQKLWDQILTPSTVDFDEKRLRDAFGQLAQG